MDSTTQNHDNFDLNRLSQILKDRAKVLNICLINIKTLYQYFQHIKLKLITFSRNQGGSKIKKFQEFMRGRVLTS